jgi:protein-L-isoaspartate(D-aspartate) O-methyltransferase
MADLRMTGIGMTSARTRDRLVQRLREQGVSNLSVLERIRNVPRHIFVDEALASRAYEDTALPIGFGQTISQPYIVARMTEALLDGPPLVNVLEIGTGCGYQTAVLAPLVERLYTIERIVAAAAPLTVPEGLLQQLVDGGGRLVVPVGPEGEQELILFTRKGERIERRSLGAVAFVPLLGGTVS